jgi:hypothetical protein
LLWGNWLPVAWIDGNWLALLPLPKAEKGANDELEENGEKLENEFVALWLWGKENWEELGVWGNKEDELWGKAEDAWGNIDELWGKEELWGNEALWENIEPDWGRAFWENIELWGNIDDELWGSELCGNIELCGNDEPWGSELWGNIDEEAEGKLPCREPDMKGEVIDAPRPRPLWLAPSPKLKELDGEVEGRVPTYEPGFWASTCCTWLLGTIMT